MGVILLHLVCGSGPGDSYTSVVPDFNPPPLPKTVSLNFLQHKVGRQMLRHVLSIPLSSRSLEGLTHPLPASVRHMTSQRPVHLPRSLTSAAEAAFQMVQKAGSPGRGPRAALSCAVHPEGSGGADHTPAKPVKCRNLMLKPCQLQTGTRAPAVHLDQE